jgi:hypothetical protein
VTVELFVLPDLHHHSKHALNSFALTGKESMTRAATVPASRECVCPLTLVKMKSRQAYYYDEKTFFEHEGPASKTRFTLKKVLRSELDSLE